MKKEQSAGAVIYYFDEVPCFLLLKYKTYWGFAKGLIEENESEKDTALREIKEETGLENFDIVPGFEEKQNWFFRWEGKLVNKEAVYFLIRVKREEKDRVKISFEHEDFKWVAKEEALKLMKIKANKEMLEKAYKFIQEYEKQGKLF